ncbi:MAG: HAMP domain-containing histidine kinase [Chloroflexi bacterium]|nr:HAMP domain-containing histidine kinase [Ktedonobacteraceae bacterium]MBV9020312.1 HAMP domain-containing histidine kinase [Ktedonobacteraceae bacterium]MBV9708494.1 HAMP domain-containing histidine kinase [Chloroflexota bacterium]
MTVNTSNTNQTNILSLITHELRSPLNTINGYLDLALGGAAGEINEQLREFLVRSRAASEHLYMLLENLLLVARADAGQWRLNCDLLNLQDVVLDAVEALQLTATDQGITVITECVSPWPLLYADFVRLQQVLYNLLSNALRFTPQGGQVTISAQLERNIGRYAVSDEHEQVVVLQVRDSGCGIAPEYQQHIFERFFQLPADVGHSRGQGLGLSVVKMIVEQHGGSVIVESSPGQGSTFICILPCLLS